MDEDKSNIIITSVIFGILISVSALVGGILVGISPCRQTENLFCPQDGLFISAFIILMLMVVFISLLIFFNLCCKAGGKLDIFAH